MPFVVVASEPEPHLQIIARQQRNHRIAPLDHHDGPFLDDLTQTGVERLAQVVQAVDVEVVELEVRPSYSWAMVKVGLVIRSVTPSPMADPLGERGLARPHLAGQQ